ncbi:MAG: hypothetical protein ACREC5_04980, partial [Thermoplasmata archaeon]
LGATWSVQLGNSHQSSVTATLTFLAVGNGSYPFTVGGPVGYRATPSAATVAVQGGNTSEAIDFGSTVGHEGSSGLSDLELGVIGIVAALIIAGIALVLRSRSKRTRRIQGEVEVGEPGAAPATK